MSSFEDELKALKQHEFEKENSRKALKQERELQEEGKKKNAEGQISALEEFAKSEIEPFFTKINMTFCNGNGKISFQKEIKTNRDEMRKNGTWNPALTDKAETSIYAHIRWDIWGEWPSMGFGEGEYGAKDLGIGVTSKSISVIVGKRIELQKGGDGTTIEVINRNDAKWREKLEQSLLSALSSGKYEWSGSWKRTS